jgi:PEP-CTERM motif
MKRRAVIFGAALALMSLASSGARAATVVVSDSGSIGSFTMTNAGIVAGTATITISGEPNSSSAINTVNGVAVASEPTSFNGPITLFVTPTGANSYSLSLLPPTYTKTVGGTVGQQAILGYNLSQGATATNLPAFFNAAGLVTSVMANANPTYDFSDFSNGLGKFNVTFTATTFGGGATSFASLFTNVGATATGNGSFSQVSTSVPEPASLALLGIGMTGFLAFRRYFKKTSVA